MPNLNILYLLLMALLANIVWLSNKGFMVYAYKAGHKHYGLSLLELLVWFAVALLIGHALEIQVMGQASPQAWEFYTITFALFLVLSFPGFVYRAFWR
jgi:Protein of unknown function (DUF2818)